MQKRAATHKISEARLEQDDETRVVVGSASSGWLLVLSSLILFGGAGIWLLLAGGSTLLLGIFVLSLAVVIGVNSPLKIKLTFDLAAQQFFLVVDYLLRFPRHVELQTPFSQIARLRLRQIPHGMNHTMDLNLVDGTHVVIEFNRRTYEADKLARKMEALAGTPAAPVMNSTQAVSVANTTETQVRMEQSLRSWSFWLFIMGAGQMIAAHGYSSWGVLLIVVGLGSFYFREAPMFVVYAATILWAGMTNMLGGSIVWVAFALLQIFLSIQIFRQYLVFHRAEQAAIQLAGSEVTVPTRRTARFFPSLSLIFGAGGLAGYCLAMLGSILNGALHFATKGDAVWTTLVFVATYAIYAGIIGLATGLASWTAGHPHKWAALLGSITGALVLVIQIGLLIVGKFL